MSIRTVIEINHDYLHQLRDDRDWFEDLSRILASGSKPEPGEFPGIRYLGQRHHSETLD